MKNKNSYKINNKDNAKKNTYKKPEVKDLGKVQDITKETLSINA